MYYETGAQEPHWPLVKTKRANRFQYTFPIKGGAHSGWISLGGLHQELPSQWVLLSQSSSGILTQIHRYSYSNFIALHVEPLLDEQGSDGRCTSYPSLVGPCLQAHQCSTCCMAWHSLQLGSRTLQPRLSQETWKYQIVFYYLAWLELAS